HNATNPWQGPVRRGWFDAVLARYALALTPRLDALVLTHLDALARRPRWWMCDAYELEASADRELVVRSHGGRAVELAASAQPPLERQERLGGLLARCRPTLEPLPAEEAAHVEFLEERLRRRVDVISRGATAADVEVRGPEVLET